MQLVADSMRHAYHVIIPAAGMGRRMLGRGAQTHKSLLPVAGRPIIDHSLEILDSRGLQRATLVVGYRRRELVQHLGNRYRAMHIDYAVARDFEITEHGWSLYLSQEIWAREQRPVLFLDADNLYHPALLDQVLGSQHENVVLVDPGLRARERDEELVLGDAGVVDRLVRGRAHDYQTTVGGFIGINRFGPDFMRSYYACAGKLFATRGRMFKYERVFDRLIQETAIPLHYQASAGAGWLNVNHPDELPQAQRLAQEIAEAVRKGSE